MKRAIAAALLLALAAGGPAALAQGSPSEAKTLFDLGAQAYEKGEYPAALQAFEQAYRLAPRPGILFSIAQAHRKQYYVAKNPAELREAIRAYREYLQKVTEGGRRSDAAQALAEIEPLAQKLDPGGGSAPAERKAETRLGVSSPVAQATLTIDGGKPQEVPFIGEVKPGKHALRVTATGFHDETREIDVAAGSVAAIDIPLREKKAHVTIVTRAGADVALDGRFVAQTPLGAPLEVDPGRHFLTVTRNGYHAFAEEIDVGRDEARTVEAPLATSSQRVASWVLIGGGTAAIAVGASLSAVALAKQNEAIDVNAKRTAGNAKASTITDFGTARDARDNFRRDAAIIGGAGALVVVTGAMLFAFDHPTVTAVPSRRDEAPKPARPQERPVEVSAAPAIAPGFWGGAVVGRF